MSLIEPRTTFFFARRTAAIAIFACTSALGLGAQQAGPPVAAQVPDLKLLASTDGPEQKIGPALNLDLARNAGVGYSSSSSFVSDAAAPDASAASSVDPVEAERLNLEGLQPPPRRRYGRPRYNDNMHNADGSPKFAFEAGIGFAPTTQDTNNYLTTSYAFQVGAGRNFNKNVAVFIQFDYDHFGINNQTLTNQINLYNSYCSPAQAAANLCTQFTTLGGNNHVWSFSVDPTYTFYGREKLGAYAVGGVGFYHKVTNFTTPTQGIGYDPYYGYYQYTANATVDHYTSNAPGFNGGLGLTYKFSRFSGERFFAEVRYVYVLNSQKTGVTYTSATGAVPANYNGNNFFPANSNRTSYLPVKFGVRF